MSDKSNVTDLPLSDAAPIPELEHKGPGRPKGTTKAAMKAKEEAKPLTPEPPPRPKKDPADVKDPYSAINQTHERMKILVANLREKHPESEVSDPINPLDVKKATMGAPMDKTAFHAPLRGLCGIAGWIGDLKPEEMPNQEQYDRCAEDWARASRHLGFTEKTAALFSAASSTAWIVVGTAARSVRKLFGNEANKDEQLRAPIAAGPPEMPKSPAAPLTDERVVKEPPVEEKKKNTGDLDEQSYR